MKGADRARPCDPRARRCYIRLPSQELRLTRIAALVIGLGMLTHPLVAQRDSVLQSRWVGTHFGRMLNLEFYDDTMLVLNDEEPLNFRLTDDSLVAVGDTIIQARWRLVLGYLLLETPDGVITMASQSMLARPLTGRWVGPLGTSADTTIELEIYRNKTARWRPITGGRWTAGEWERETRDVTLTWPDDTEWTGQYDPIGNAILFQQTVPQSSSTILRRAFR